MSEVSDVILGCGSAPIVNSLIRLAAAVDFTGHRHTIGVSTTNINGDVGVSTHGSIAYINKLRLVKLK